MDDRNQIDSLEELRSLGRHATRPGYGSIRKPVERRQRHALCRRRRTRRAVALGDVADIGATTTHSEAEAGAIVSVGRARVAVAEAVLAVEAARRGSKRKPSAAAHPLRAASASLASLGRGILSEIRHITADRPRSILLRIVITVAIGLALVAAFHLTGMKRYDLSGLTLYLFSGVVGSVVCTNSLCFEAERVRAALAAGQRVWRILVVQNLAMAILITLAGLPVVAALTWTREANPVALVDQLVTMIFIWLGVGNVLSVIYPLRHEPVAARLKDGTWKLVPVLVRVVLRRRAHRQSDDLLAPVGTSNSKRPDRRRRLGGIPTRARQCGPQLDAADRIRCSVQPAARRSSKALPRNDRLSETLTTQATRAAQ